MSTDSSRSRKVRRAILHAGLTALLFVTMDTAIFRSGFYARFASPKWQTAMLRNLITTLPPRAGDGRREILIVGNSQMQWAFSICDFETTRPRSPFHFHQGFVPTTHEKAWYHVLRKMDPDRSRFDAILIGLPNYVVEAQDEDHENSLDTATVVGPLLTVDEWPAFLGTYTDPGRWWQVLGLALFAGHVYAPDAQDFLLNPGVRLRDLATERQRGRGACPDLIRARGRVDRVLEADRAGRGCPVEFTNFECRLILKDARAAVPDAAVANTARNATTQARWLDAIGARYATGTTRVFFFQLPRAPFPVASRAPIAGAPALPTLIPPRPNVEFLDASTFTDLERPEYFHDSLHLNGVGRAAFTDRLERALTRIALSAR